MKNGFILKEDGTKCWYVNGILHREDGPAVEWPSGTKCWYVNGRLHRLDGPAIEFASGYKEYWINNVRYSQSDWEKQVEVLH
jgi:hypothetical protein